MQSEYEPIEYKPKHIDTTTWETAWRFLTGMSQRHPDITPFEFMMYAATCIEYFKIDKATFIESLIILFSIAAVRMPDHLLATRNSLQYIEMLLAQISDENMRINMQTESQIILFHQN
ncbi:hypothetical protein C5B42_05340 [Candidatus Cerribacteria bacterium 'Amazon FNV 2010 28 9']|uniref:Uncharacterized protein n=1 Tax=Candidatus Cerribacteria bacterium 'Amazon FNV 2010 28 9' TaxID=2081795 RepID=A0A317JNY7_9BACT|nr:MAG: hypothetical protein C5B42_05340 [Candidatus Cerribacteria bacterium 'Amazon FNV 2010 28 9']